jgi:hypothetical protein
MKRVGYLLAFVPLAIGSVFVCVGLLFVIPAFFLLKRCDDELDQAGIRGDLTLYPRHKARL